MITAAPFAMCAGFFGCFSPISDIPPYAVMYRVWYDEYEYCTGLCIVTSFLSKCGLMDVKEKRNNKMKLMGEEKERGEKTEKGA